MLVILNFAGGYLLDYCPASRYLLVSSCLHVELFTVVYERPHFSNILHCFIVFFAVLFTISSKCKGREKRKCTNLSIGAKLEPIKKLEWGVSVARVCDKYCVKKQTVSDICRSKEKLQAFAVKFNVDPNKDKKGVVHMHKHMEVARSKDLEKAVHKWYVQERPVGVNVCVVDILDVREISRTYGYPFQW